MLWHFVVLIYCKTKIEVVLCKFSHFGLVFFIWLWICF